MATTIKEIKLTDTTSSYEVRVELVPGKSFRDYIADYKKHLAEPKKK